MKKRTKEEAIIKESEDRLQAQCFEWFHNGFPHLRGLLWHCPNELSGLVHMSVSNKMKAMGLVAGVPDLEFHYRGRSYFIELKNPQGTGRVSKEQKKIHDVLNANKFTVWVCDSLKGFEDLMSTIIKDTSEQFTNGLNKADYFYKHKVFSYLYDLTDGEVLMLESVTNLSTRQKFANVVSEFITEGYDKLDGFELLFTPDYKGIYKKMDGIDTIISYYGKFL